MSRFRDAFALPLLLWLLASLLTAVLAHGVIWVTGQLERGRNSYAEHGHAAVADVALAALMIAAIVILRSSLHTQSRSKRVDPIVLLSQCLAGMHLSLPCAFVALGGIATLTMMEFSEQLSAFGYVSLADTFGGSTALGVAIVLVVAAVITIAGLRFARAIVATASSVASMLFAWIFANATLVIDRAAFERISRRRRSTSTLALSSRSLGLRAPPLALA